MLNNSVYKMNSFIKLILFILSIITILLSNNIMSFVFIVIISIIVMVLMRKNLLLILKKLSNIYQIILFLLCFIISKYLFLKLLLISLNTIVLFMTTNLSHIYLSLLKIFYPLKRFKLNYKNLVFIIVSSFMYIHIYISRLSVLIKFSSYRYNNKSYLVENSIKLLKRNNYLTKSEIKKFKEDICINNCDDNIKQELYNESKITIKDYLLVIVYIGIIILCVVKEVL